MAYNIDFLSATSGEIEAALCERLESIRLSRNMTQRQLAKEAGVSPRTIGRLAKGEGVSLDTFIRVLTALRIQQSLENLLPDPTVRPIERVGAAARERKRAHPISTSSEVSAWSWGDEGDGSEQ
jgi:transcriptional regulator with XRE-family HTH domain